MQKTTSGQQTATRHLRQQTTALPGTNEIQPPSSTTRPSQRPVRSFATNLDSGHVPTPAPPARPARRNRGNDSYDNIEPLLTEIAETDITDPRRNVLREEAIGRCLPLAEHIARRFAGRGENFDDLLQIARLGLVRAVDRFDPDHGATFLAFAVPTIMGEVRRHFRDYTWAVRAPRRVKETQQRLGPTTETLTQRLGRLPRAREIAEELGVEPVEITQAMIANNAYQTSPIDGSANAENDDAPQSLLDSIGSEDPGYRSVEDYDAVKPFIAALPERECRVLILRFFRSQTQRQIAAQLGVSQMQVSRILSNTLDTLREQALRD